MLNFSKLIRDWKPISDRQNKIRPGLQFYNLLLGNRGSLEETMDLEGSAGSKAKIELEEKLFIQFE